MTTLVLTVIGDDRSGLVARLSDVIARHNGNWATSQMAHLAGKFAGIVLVDVPDENVEALAADLHPLSEDLVITVQKTPPSITSTGCHRLIRENGAQIITTSEEAETLILD